MKSDFEHKLYYDDVNIMGFSNYKTGAWLVNRPCRVKGIKDCVWPVKAMLALLDEK